VVFVALLGRHHRGYDDTTLDELWKIQRWLGIFSAADDLRGERQTIYGDCLGTERSGQDEMPLVPELKDQAPRNGAVCIAVVEREGFVSEQPSGNKLGSAPSPPLGRGLG